MLRIVTAAVFACSLIGQALAGDLKVIVAGVTSADGEVLGAVYKSASDFLHVDAAVAKFKLKAGKGQVVAVLHDLPPGRYALAIFHDTIGDGVLHRNALGVPAEDYGFSNNARGLLGPPSFGQAAFDLAGEGQSVEVTLSH